MRPTNTGASAKLGSVSVPSVKTEAMKRSGDQKPLPPTASMTSSIMP